MSQITGKNAENSEKKDWEKWISEKNWNSCEHITAEIGKWNVVGELECCILQRLDL